MRPRLLLIAGACAIAAFAGCGRDEPPAARPRLQPRQAASAPDIPVRTAGVSSRRPARDADAADSFGPPGRSAPQIDPDADPNDVFVVVDEPNFEIIASSGEPHPADVFYAATPAAGQNSSTFIVVEPGSPSAAGRPRSDFELPTGFEPVAGAGYSSEGLPRRIVCQADGAEMVLVPAGISVLGTEDGPAETTPRLEVYLDDFYIDVAEVTLEPYGRYLADRKTQVARLLEEPLNKGAAGDQPALGLSWGAARDYARWAGKELPTEAQWEKAARGATGFAHPWGDGRAVFARARTLSQIDPVGSYPLDRSPYGVLDMAGNAREWCLDHYVDRAFADAAASGESPLTNWPGPRRPSAESHRVIKGNGPNWNVWQRAGLGMGAHRPDVGFRCVLVLKPAEPESAETEADSGRESESVGAPPRGSRRRPRR